MPRFAKSPLRTLLCVLYLALELVLPMLCVIYLAFASSPDSRVPLGLQAGNRLFVLFAALPAYAVYAWLVLKEHFPEQPRDIFQLFLPLLSSLVLGIYWWPEDGLLELFIFEGLPFYLGLNLLFYLGFAVLAWEKQGPRPEIPVIIAFVLLSLGLFAPAGVICLQGWELAQGIDIFQNVLTGVDYFGSILLTAWANLPIMKSLYAKGEL